MERAYPVQLIEGLTFSVDQGSHCSECSTLIRQSRTFLYTAQFQISSQRSVVVLRWVEAEIAMNEAHLQIILVFLYPYLQSSQHAYKDKKYSSSIPYRQEHKHEVDGCGFESECHSQKAKLRLDRYRLLRKQADRLWSQYIYLFRHL